MGIPNIRETETVNPSIAPHGRQCSEPTALISGPMAILGSGMFPHHGLVFGSFLFHPAANRLVRPACLMGQADMKKTPIRTVEDETLKKVLMSWYYAGYYTGLYQGQQEQARKRPSKQQENDTKQDDTPSIGN